MIRCSLPPWCLSPGAERSVGVHREGGLQLRGGGRPPGPAGRRPRPHQPAQEVAPWRLLQLKPQGR